MSSSVLSASAKGATFLILLQIGSRLLTFAANQILLRFLSPELLGVSAQLELYSISVLFFARESLRVALQRQATGIQTVVNLAYLAVLIGLPLSYGLAIIYLRADVPQVPYFVESLRIYGVATLLELLSEPGFAIVQQQMLYRIRASAETTATIGRCAATCMTAIWASRNGINLGVLPFAAGQLTYASALLVIYVASLLRTQSKDTVSLFPHKLPASEAKDAILGYFSRPLAYLSLNLFLQSSFKYVLTQGDSILIAALATLQDQGAYALASNYGGLIARMIFQPIEESGRNLFAKLCAPVAQKGSNKQEPSPSNLRQALTTLTDIIKLYNLISLLAISLGPTAAPLLLRLIAGNRWLETGAGEVLAHYCYYIPLLATNGVSEAFVAAVASNTELHQQSLLMGLFFAVFGAASYIFLTVLQLGAKGLVYANCVNMGLRIVFNIYFIKKFFGARKLEFSISSTLPSWTSIVGAAANPIIFSVSKGAPSQSTFLGQLINVAAVAIGYLALLAYGERTFAIHCYRMFKPVKEN